MLYDETINCAYLWRLESQYMDMRGERDETGSPVGGMIG